MVIKNHDIKYHLYADDTQLYKSVPSTDFNHLCLSIGHCIEDVKIWMNVNKLKLNEDKTEVLLCNTNKDVESTEKHIHIESEKVPITEKVKNLGVYFDSKLSMSPQVNHLCKIMYLELRKISQLSFLSENSLKTLISSFMFSRLDYCNSLLANLPDETLNKLQRFQNQAARLVLKKRKRDHITPMLIKLHWLPVKARVIYKSAVLTHKCVHNRAPLYLSSLIKPYIPQRSLRSGDHSLLETPKNFPKKLGERSFTHFSPKIWNSLPLSLRQITSETAFKSRLKTHLMKTYLDC